MLTGSVFGRFLLRLDFVNHDVTHVFLDTTMFSLIPHLHILRCGLKSVLSESAGCLKWKSFDNDKKNCGMEN